MNHQEITDIHHNITIEINNKVGSLVSFIQFLTAGLGMDLLGCREREYKISMYMNNVWNYLGICSMSNVKQTSWFDIYFFHPIYIFSRFKMAEDYCLL